MNTTLGAIMPRLVCFALLTLGASGAQAATLAGFPAPGGTTFANVGSTGSAGGQTRTYTLTDSSAFDQLWWGVTSPTLGNNCCFAPTELTTIGAFGNASMTWSGTVQFSFNNGFLYTDTVSARLTSTVVSGASNWLNPASVGIAGAGSPLAVIEVTDPNQFVVNNIFEVFSGGLWVAFQPWFDSHAGAGAYGSLRSFGGQFWYTDPVPVGAGGEVPLPAALPLFATGLGVLALVARRRKRKAPAAHG